MQETKQFEQVVPEWDNVCQHCGDSPAVEIRFNKQAVNTGDDDLGGWGFRWSETYDIVYEHDTSDDDEPEYVVKDYCSKHCIHLAGEMRRGIEEGDGGR